MGMIKERKKFKTRLEQKNPTNLKGNVNQLNNSFDIDHTTIKEQQTKK
ncbi:hypothetical protein [Winogradskyella endarachnes]|nr:hypothetical protein [Winogradskyella endarachnes]